MGGIKAKSTDVVVSIVEVVAFLLLRRGKHDRFMILPTFTSSVQFVLEHTIIMTFVCVNSLCSLLLYVFVFT